MLEKLASKVKIPTVNNQETHILAIIGQGYVGLPLAMAAVDAGWRVIGVDIFEAKVAQINGGSSPVEDITDIRLQAALTNGFYKATTDYSLVSNASVITLCVPTPLNEKREPDLTLLLSAVKGIAPFLSNETLVVSESTSYPGTLRNEIIPIINRLKPKMSKSIYFASAPERVNPGDAVWNQKNTPRLVGAIDAVSQKRALAFYESICDTTICVSTPEVAEAAKLLENTFRLVNIALINEFAQLCAAGGINVQEVINAASSKPYGFMPFRPGVGVGGHCIPIDPLYLSWWARQNGRRPVLVELADQINLKMPKFVAERAIEMIDPLKSNPKILILGVAYKAGVGDTRESPVSELQSVLESKGVEVAWHDPLVLSWRGTKSVELEWDCDLAILAIKQPSVDIAVLLNRGVAILDCTNSHPSTVGVTSI